MRPVRMEARAGLHTGEAQKKLSNRVPCAANRSRLGVWMSALPAQCMAQAPWSSVRINRRLGLFFMKFCLISKRSRQPRFGAAGLFSACAGSAVPRQPGCKHVYFADLKVVSWFSTSFIRSSTPLACMASRNLGMYSAGSTEPVSREGVYSAITLVRAAT